MNNFIFFSSYYEAIKELPVEKQGQVYKAIVDYAMEAIEPDLKGIQRSIFTLIKPYIDSSKKKQEYGAMGGAPMGNTNAKKQAKNNLTLNKETSQKQAKNNLSLKNKTSNQIIEYEEEKEYIKKEINKERKNTVLTDSELLSFIEEEFKDADVCQKFKDYAEMRKAMGKNKAIRTLSTLNSCINKLRKYAKTKQEAIEILDYSIANCYQGLFDKFGHDRKEVAKEAIPYAN